MTFSRLSGSVCALRSALCAVCVLCSVCVLVDPHHPAAGQPAFGLQEHRALRLEDVERVRPELQPQDVALVGEQVVGDVQPRHRRQVRADDPIDDERAHRGGLAGAVLEIVERGGADGEPALVAARTIR